ncbi:MAG: D-ribose ABC transporter substrate-binding protein [Anaerolineae bacterium]
MHLISCRRTLQHLPLTFLLISVVLSLASGCTSAPTPIPPTATPASTLTVGMSLSNLANPFFASMRDGANEAATRLNVTLVVEDAADNADTQAQQIEDLIDQGVGVLLINPVDSDAIVASVEAANAANIPVITIDRSANGGTVLAHIASDNVAGGRMAGNYLAETLGNTGHIVELTGIEGTSAARDRGAGFNEAIAAFPEMQVIVRETANFSREEGQTVFASILEANPNIDAVFAHNDEMILGAIEAARAAGRLSEIKFVGFDAVDDALTALESGELLATIAQQPAEMGRLGVENAVRALNGESVEASIPVDLALITR